jgi:yecA family protein
MLMKSLITKKEENIFKKLLSLSSSPETTLSYDELRGFLYGIAITPEVISPDEWLPVIFGEEILDIENEEQIFEMAGTLFAVLNKHIAAFHDNSLFMPFDMNDIKEKDFERIFEWTSGFEEALSLRPECWEEQQDLTEEEQDHLMNSLVVVEGIVYPEDAIDMFEHLPAEELAKIGVILSTNEISKIMQIQLFMLQALELSVETIQGHAATLEKKRREKLRSSTKPFLLHSRSPGKNVKCPCGSGKTFATCCGIGGNHVKKQAKKSNVIQVEFPQHGKRLPKKSVKTIPQEGQSYQLEISLAFTDPVIWRRIEVPSSLTLEELHTVIQMAMGWQNLHLHSFRGGMISYGPQLADDYMDTAIRDESCYLLSDLEKEFLQGVVYTYDFGDNWEHVILLEKVNPENEANPLPCVLEGAGACPPEDIGGAPMYEEFLKFLLGAGDSDLKEYFDIPALQAFDPAHFDLQLHNNLLQSWYRGKKGK